ncbi:glycine/D-amino acid oxidase-like deaminating enzyme [Streptomyces sp. SAI-119]|nr:glycine/D-amino acid oxidase-like deaminating enzyme [Streptomyces sp. SAI-119]
MSVTRRHLLAAGAGAAVAAGVQHGASAADLPTIGTYDVVVIGSGAAGMTAALTAVKQGLSTVVLEKAPTFGGSAARSGAGIWIPNNPVILAAGVPDTPAKAAAYLAAVVGPDVPVARQRAFLTHGPAMISFVMANSPLRFRWMEGYSDYYPELPGGLPGGRSIEPDQFDGKLLGAELAHLNPPYLDVPAGLVVFSADYKWLALSAVSLKGAAVAAECLARGTKAALLGQTPLTMGQSLAAALRKGLLNANVPVRLNTPLTELYVENGAVAGAVTPGGLFRARRGVIVGSGGFEHNAAMRAQYQRQPIGTEWTVGAKENTGDGIRAGQRLGADVALMDDAWWGPAIPLPDEPYFCLAERTLPGGPRRQRGRPAVRQRGRPLQRCRPHHVRPEPDRPRHPVLADRGPELPQPVPLQGHRADLRPPRRLVQLRRRPQGLVARRPGRVHRRPGRRPACHRRPLQLPCPEGRRHGLRAR